MKLSVVIIGRNEGDRLVRCIESVRAITPVDGGVEIIYVDSASVDGSPDRARSLGARVLSLSEGRPTAARGRNAGWRAASGDFVLFLDGDTILHPDFVRQALTRFSDPKIAVVWGHRREIRPEDSIYNRVLDLDWIAPAGPSDFCGGDALMRRSVLEEVGGYDQELIAGEEPEMCRRMRGKGYVILHVDLPMTGHDMAMKRWSQYWRRATRTGYAYLEVSDRFRGSGLPFWEHEVRHNRKRAVILLLAPAASIALAALLRSSWPLVLAPAFYLAISIRTAQRNAWKGASFSTRFLYGLHSHFQQIPILVGQWQRIRDRKAGLKRGLIEYKGAGS